MYVPPPSAVCISFCVRFARLAGFHLIIFHTLPPARADSTDFGQPRNQLCNICALADMRCFDASGQLGIVCPGKLAPSGVQAVQHRVPGPGEHGHCVLGGAEAVRYC